MNSQLDETPATTASGNRPSLVLRCRLLLVLAAVLWSLSGLIVKSPVLSVLDESTRGPLLACYRALFAGFLLTPFVRVRDVRWRPGLVPMVVAFSVMNVLFVTSLVLTTSAAAIFLQFTASAWVAVISWLFLKEHVPRSTLLCLTGAILGIVWIVVSEHAPHRALGNFIALGSGFSLACTLVMLRVLRNENAAWLTALNHVVAGLVLLPWVLTFDVQLTTLQWVMIAILGIVQMGMPYVLFAYSVRYLSATEAVLITLLEPILNPIWVWLAWQEDVNSNIWIGGAMILGGLVSKYVIDFRNSRFVQSDRMKPESTPN